MEMEQRCKFSAHIFGLLKNHLLTWASSKPHARTHTQAKPQRRFLGKISFIDFE